MGLYKVEENTIIIREGTPGNFFYIIKEGAVEISQNQNIVRTLSRGESFGELALLHNAMRSRTVRSLKKCQFYCIDRVNFRSIMNEMNNQNFDENKAFLDSISLLDSLREEQKSLLASKLVKENHEENKFIFKEGDTGDCLYLIREGEVNILNKDNVIVRIFKKGEFFGQLSILMDIPRTMTVITKTKCIFYSISIESIKNIFGEKFRDVLLINSIKQALIKSKYFSKLDIKYIENIFEHFKLTRYEKGCVVLRKGYLCHSKILIILEGNLINVTYLFIKANSRKVLSERNSVVFEEKIIFNSKEALKENYIAEPDCLLAECELEYFTKSIGGNLQKIIDHSAVIKALRSVSIFKDYPNEKISQLEKFIRIEKYTDGKKIINQGDINFNFYIIKLGKVDIFINSNYVRTLNTNEYFGERALFLKESRSATVKANGDTEVFCLSQEEFDMLIEDYTKNLIKSRFYLRDDGIQLKDLEWKSEIGSGNYGRVSLVASRKTQSFYAIKAVSKLKIDDEQLHSYLSLEKAILLQVDHNFVVKLIKTIKDSKNIYFLMEFIRGKELFDVIRDIGLLNKAQAQFYAASMIIAINYIHKKGFIHRDVKPENVIVNDKVITYLKRVLLSLLISEL